MKTRILLLSFAALALATAFFAPPIIGILMGFLSGVLGGAAIFAPREE
jgi:hypothetical protein